ncbi:MAG TPA: hypothetical protein VER36_05205 [Flavisolibacter sp.]|nr:hypothetical protein [Flavisolibacter sp.]
MIKSLFKFKTLADLGAFIKAARLNAYIINTSNLTILAAFTEVSMAIAIEDYQAVKLELIVSEQEAQTHNS